jgi:hypothetical protein
MVKFFTIKWLWVFRTFEPVRLYERFIFICAEDRTEKASKKDLQIRSAEMPTAALCEDWTPFLQS